MPLTLVATAGAANANAYATQAAALAAADYRIGPTGVAFKALTSDQQIQALVSAASDIDSLGDARVDGWIVDFLGERATDTQSMEWPRADTGVFDDNELPSDLVKANIELAFTYAPLFAAGTTDPLNADTSLARVKEKTVDVLTTIWFEPGPTAQALERFPAMVQRLLSSLLDFTLIGGEWGSAVVTRSS